MRSFTESRKKNNSNGGASGNKLFFQPKLTIGPSNDVYEQEADAVADKVMRMENDEAAMIHPKSISSVQRKCSDCEEEDRVQRKESGESQAEAPSIVSDVVSSGGGKRLDDNTRSFMEDRFGYDFSSVKIHDDAVSAKSAQSINALAYTSGNNIVFNNGQYSPDTNIGKKLLAHELTHFIQQKSDVMSKSKIQRTCDLDFTGYTGSSCEGTIEVGATTISSPIIGYYHLFVLYTDSTGRKFYLRGGPGSGGGGYGNIVTICAPYEAGEIEYDPRNILEQVYQGVDACNKLRTMQARLNEIESWNVAYVPAGPNSNSVIATLLRAAGLPVRKPMVPAPGFEMEVTSSGGSELSQDRPTSLLISLGGGSGLLLGAELQQRLYTFSPVIAGGIPIPIPLELNAGLYSFPDQGRIGGSIGVSTDISLINLPLPVFSPLGIVLGGGFTAGAVSTPDATTGVTSTDPEIGGYGRAGLYTDINRFRISPMYQYNAFHNTEKGDSSDAHSFVVQFGYTF